MLLERAPAMEWLDRALDDAWQHAGRLVALTGEAGIGKTSVLSAFADAHRHDTDVRVGVCDHLVTQRPFAPLVDIARGTPWADLLVGESTRGAVFEATLDELRSSRRRLAILIEDVHWADEATLDLLVFLRRRIESTRALVVVSYRDDELDAEHPLRPVLAEIIGRTQQRLRLDPLTRSAVTELASGSAIDPEELHHVTGGNPFFVTETLADAGPDVPLTVRDAVLARTQRLPPAARRALEAAAIVPGGAETWLVESLAEVSVEDLDVCIERGLLRTTGPRIAFRHELARRAVLDTVPPVRRRRLHRSALSLLEGDDQADVDSTRLVHHALEAGDPSPILAYAPAAGARAAALGAHREAARHYGAALEHAHLLGPRERAEMYELHSYQCYLTDQLPEAIDARERALALWGQEGERRRKGDAMRWLSRLSWFAGRNAQATSYAEAAVDTLGGFPDSVELAMALSNMAQLRMLAQDVDGAVTWGEQAIALAEAISDEDVLSHALNNVGTALLRAGRDGGRQLLERSLDLARRNDLHEHAARALTNLGSSLVAARQYEDGLRFLDEGIEHSTTLDLDTWRVYMTTCLARARFEQADWDEAVDLASWVLGRHGAAPVSLVDALVVLGRVRARRGDPEVWAPLDRSLALAQDAAELQRLAPVAAARAEARLLAGEPDHVWGEIEAVLPLAREQGDGWAVGELSLLARRAGVEVDIDDAPCAAPYRLQLHGEVEAAADLWTELGCRYEAADARADSNDPAVVAAALEALQALGAGPRATAAARRLRGMGRRVPRGPNATTRANAAQLTDRELDVVRLLAVGRSNPEIAEELRISPKTAGHHVSRILAKLGARNRSEAAVMAAKLDL